MYPNYDDPKYWPLDIVRALQELLVICEAMPARHEPLHEVAKCARRKLESRAVAIAYMEANADKDAS